MVTERRSTLQQPTFLDQLPEPEKRPCGSFHRDVKTETIWPGESHVRLTWTCQDCGRVTGRA